MEVCCCRLSYPYSRRLRLIPLGEFPLAPLFTPSHSLPAISEPAGSSLLFGARYCALLSRFPSRCRKRRCLAATAPLNTTFHRWRRKTTHIPPTQTRSRSRRSHWETRRDKEQEQQPHRSCPGRRVEFTCIRPGRPPPPPGPSFSFRRGTAAAVFVPNQSVSRAAGHHHHQLPTVLRFQTLEPNQLRAAGCHHDPPPTAFFG